MLEIGKRSNPELSIRATGLLIGVNSFDVANLEDGNNRNLRIEISSGIGKGNKVIGRSAVRSDCPVKCGSV
jgi:hypothetical protein